MRFFKNFGTFKRRLKSRLFTVYVTSAVHLATVIQSDCWHCTPYRWSHCYCYYVTNVAKYCEMCRCHLILSNRSMFRVSISLSRCRPNFCRIFSRKLPYLKTNRY